MASACSSGIRFQPLPSYGGEEDDLNCSIGFTFVDFLPETEDPNKLSSYAVYDTFRMLVERANDFLRAHRSWKVITCESVRFESKRELAGEVDPENMRNLVYKDISTHYIRGLRLWISSREKEAEAAQQIGYRNLVPRQVSDGWLFGNPSYETLDDVIRNFNSSLHYDPIPGRVITVETQEMKLPDTRFQEFDPDRSNWKERVSWGKRCLFVIRVFYELLAGHPEEIGIRDFIPERVTRGFIITLPKYEHFTDVVREASDWCSRQQGLRICNAKSVKIKMKISNESVDTQKTMFKEHANRRTYYLRILRVAYTRPKATDMHDVNPSNTGVAQLTCRTFKPAQLTTGIFVPKYETLQETKRRVSAWVKATGARVISAETSAMRMFTGGERKHGPEVSFSYNVTEGNVYWLVIIRLYLNGAYNEPPPDMLPPLPELQHRKCCVIS